MRVGVDVCGQLGEGMSVCVYVVSVYNEYLVYLLGLLVPIIIIRRFT